MRLIREIILRLNLFLDWLGNFLADSLYEDRKEMGNVPRLYTKPVPRWMTVVNVGLVIVVASLVAVCVASQVWMWVTQ